MAINATQTPYSSVSPQLQDPRGINGAPKN